MKMFKLHCDAASFRYLFKKINLFILVWTNIWIRIPARKLQMHVSKRWKCVTKRKLLNGHKKSFDNDLLFLAILSIANHFPLQELSMRFFFDFCQNVNVKVDWKPVADLSCFFRGPNDICTFWSTHAPSIQLG